MCIFFVYIAQLNYNARCKTRLVPNDMYILVTKHVHNHNREYYFSLITIHFISPFYSKPYQQKTTPDIP